MTKCVNFNKNCKNCDGIETWVEGNKTFTRVACPSWDNTNVKIEEIEEEEIEFDSEWLEIIELEELASAEKAQEEEEEV